MKRKYLIILVLLLSLQSLKAQTGYIHLEGILDSTILAAFNTRTLLVKVYDPAKKIFNGEEIIEVPLTEAGRFSCRIAAKPQLNYLSFWMQNDNRGSGGMLPVHFPARESPLDEVYLFEASDSIHVFFGQNGRLSFRGSGAEKLNCQFQLYNQPVFSESIKIRERELLREGRITETLTLRENSALHSLQIQQEILTTYQAALSREMHTILSFQAEGRVRHQLIANIWKISRSGTPDYSKPTLQNYYRNYLQINLETLKDASPINSPHYMAYLYHAEWNRHKLFSTNLERGTGFKPVFELIKTGYKGKFRDQLLFQAIKSLSEYFHADIAANMHALTRCLTDGNYLHALKTWDQQQQAAYPFELEDTDGKIHNLKDFKGKVLILDFWFTHCTWCVRLNAAMHSIMEKYKRDPDVVFLSVCLDVKKESWKRSIAGGKYTSEGVLNLFTNGLGRAHPMMAYYNFVGAPQQLIIGKDGRVVSSKPPRPDMGMNYKVKRAGEKGALKPDAKGTLNNPPAKAFIALIETALGARSTAL